MQDKNAVDKRAYITTSYITMLRAIRIATMTFPDNRERLWATKSNVVSIQQKQDLWDKFVDAKTEEDKEDYEAYGFDDVSELSIEEANKFDYGRTAIGLRPMTVQQLHMGMWSDYLRHKDRKALRAENLERMPASEPLCSK